jgi:elongation factor Ts
VARHEDFAGLKNIACFKSIFQWFHQNISESAKKKSQFESGKEDLQNKPEEIRNKIVEGRIEKSLKNKLLDQEYIRDPNIC